MSRPKIASTVIVLTTLIVAGLVIPLPLHVETMYIIEPHDVKHVYVTTPGELVRFGETVRSGRRGRVRSGDTVKQGDLLAELANVEKQDEFFQLEKVDRRAQLAEIDMYSAINDQAKRLLAVEKLQSINEQISELRQQLDNLTITAPCNGVIVEPPRKQPPTIEDGKTQLTTWHGTPLDDRNTQCFLEERTHLLSIAPDQKFQAVLLVDQADKNDVVLGQPLELKFDHLSDKTYRGTVESISSRHLEFVPELLSNKLGGDVPTVSDSKGRERLLSRAYQATVIVDQDAPLLRTGMRGRARFLVDTRSAGEWVWRYVRRTFHFRL